MPWPRVPKGVAREFLAVLEGDERAARLRFFVLLGVAVLLPAVAWYVAPPWGFVSSAAATAVGLGLGLLWAQRRVRAYEESLRSAWAAWMRAAVASDTVAETHRRVRGRRGRMLPYLYAALLTTLWALEVLLFTLALNNETALWWGHVVAAANGLLVGVLLGHALRAWRWSRTFHASLADMMAAGEIGAWGVA